MPVNKTECDMVVARKAARLNLTVGSMWLMLELAEDVERVSYGNVQGMIIRAVGDGTEMKLHSMNATYYVRLIAGRLQLRGSLWRCGTLALHESDESVAEYEKIRAKILQIEGWLEYEPGEPEAELDTCQKPQREVAHE